MVAISAKADVKRLTRNLNAIQRKEIPKATNTALNRTLKNVTTSATRQLAPFMATTQKAIRDVLAIKKSSWRRLRASVTATHKPINLGKFKGRQTKRGVSAAAYGKRRVYEGAFLRRGNQALKRTGPERYPLKALWGPSITQAWADQGIDSIGMRTAKQRFPGHFATALKARLRGYGRRRGNRR